MGVKHILLPDGQPPTVASTVLPWQCGPMTNETEMGAVLFTKNGEGRNFDFDFDNIIFYFSFQSMNFIKTYSIGNVPQTKKTASKSKLFADTATCDC